MRDLSYFPKLKLFSNKYFLISAKGAQLFLFFLNKKFSEFKTSSAFCWEILFKYILSQKILALTIRETPIRTRNVGIITKKLIIILNLLLIISRLSPKNNLFKTNSFKPFLPNTDWKKRKNAPTIYIA